MHVELHHEMKHVCVLSVGNSKLVSEGLLHVIYFLVFPARPPPHRPRAPAWRKSRPSWGWPWSDGCSGGWCSAGGQRRRWWTWRRWCGAMWWQTHWRRRKRKKRRMRKRRWAPVWWPGGPSLGPRRWSPDGPGLCCGAAAHSAPLQRGRGEKFQTCDPTELSLRLNVSTYSPSLFMPACRHFFSRHAWHWLRWALSTGHMPVPAWHLLTHSQDFNGGEQVSFLWG